MAEAEALLAGRPHGAPQQVLLEHHGRSFTRAGLEQLIEARARDVCARLAPGSLLALWLPNGPQLLALYLACFRSGVVAMPLSPALKWPEVQAIVQAARPAGLITTSANAGANASEIERTAACWWSDDGNLGLRGPHGATAQPAPRAGELAEDDDRLMLVLHTSGSSGIPKGVMVPRRALRDLLQYRLDHCALSEHSVAVVASCVAQSVGLYQSLALLAAGARSVLLDSYESEALAAAVARERPSHLILVVSAWERLLQHPSIDAHALGNLRFAAAGADRLTAGVQQRFSGLTGRYLRCSYGLTESSWALINDGTRPEKALALGRPGPGIEIRLHDGQGRPVAAGEVGEILIRSPRNMLGYLHDAASTRVVLQDGWLHTGDLAYQDGDGDLWFAGRSKDIIVRASGDTVSPAEVEDVLRRHPAVAACLVVGRTSSTGSEVPWALVVQSAEASVDQLREFLQRHLADHKVPDGIEFVPELPLGLSGKLQRRSARSV